MRRRWALVVGAVVALTGVRAAAVESFSFTLPQRTQTSAGVFSADGRLVRTLWSGVGLAAGTYTRLWDGTDDQGHLASDGSYQVRVLSSQTQYTWEGVVGNTSDEWSGSSVLHFMSTISGMAVAGSTAYIAVGYDEGYSSQNRISTSDTGSKVEILRKGAQFTRVATDGVRVYWAGQDPNAPNDGFVMATTVADDSPVSFANATPYTMTYGDPLTGVPQVYPAIDLFPSCSPGSSDGASCADQTPAGIAVQQSHNYLFVTHAAANALDVLDKITGALVNSYSYVSPGNLTVDSADNLWMIYGQSGSQVVQSFSVGADGSLTEGVSVAGLAQPLALAATTVLLVADGGQASKLKHSTLPDMLSGRWEMQEGMQTILP